MPKIKSADSPMKMASKKIKKTNQNSIFHRNGPIDSFLLRALMKYHDHPRFVLMHLPGKITYREIDEMIATVDKNEDWKISYSEFRVIH